MRPVRRRSLGAFLALVTGVLLVSLLPAASAPGAARVRDVLGLTAPGQVSVGAAALLSGRLTDISSRPLYGGNITFYYEHPGAHSWTALSSVRTDSRGYYHASFNIPAAIYFAARYAGNGRYTGAWSNTRLIEVVKAIPADGTNYWASDGCHYYVANRTWYGDICAAYQTDAAGNAIKTIYNIYAYDNRVPSHIGVLKYQLNTAFPGSLVWRVPSDPEYQTVLWSSVPRNNVNAEPQIEIYFQGGWIWTTISKLQQLVATLQAQLAAEQQQGTTAAPTDLVTVSGASETPKALTDLANGVDTLGGNVQLGQALSNVYSLSLSSGVTLGVCGETTTLYCSPL
jgi:hypothetical protein